MCHEVSRSTLGTTQTVGKSDRFDVPKIDGIASTFHVLTFMGVEHYDNGLLVFSFILRIGHNLAIGAKDVAGLDGGVREILMGIASCHQQRSECQQ